MSCCSHSPGPHPEEITSDTDQTGGWVSFSAGLMIGEKSLDLAETQTADSPALNLVTCLATILLPFNISEVQAFMGDGQL
jgi:hypothetical protein